MSAASQDDREPHQTVGPDLLEPLAIVRAWHDALNAGDVDRLIRLTSDDVEIGGPKGSGRGSALLRDWFGRAGIRLEPRRTFQRGATVVVEQVATWQVAGESQATEPVTVASVFVVRDGRVASTVRHADVPTALAAADLSAHDLT